MDDKITLDFEVYDKVYKALERYHHTLTRYANSFSNEKANARSMARANEVKALLEALAAADPYCD
jgi:hypothetical protein